MPKARMSRVLVATITITAILGGSAFAQEVDELRKERELEALREEAHEAIEQLEQQEEQERQDTEKLSRWNAGRLAWALRGYSTWIEGRPEQVEAEQAAMAAFDCMFLAVGGGPDNKMLRTEAARLFAYAYDRAGQALPYDGNPDAFVPYNDPSSVQEDFWIGTLFSDARARIARLLDGTEFPAVIASLEFRDRNCGLVGKP